MTEADAEQTHICTLTVQGEVTNDDLEALGGTNMTGATRIDLSGATIASGSSIDNILVPTTLVSLVLPPNNIVSSTLANTLKDLNDFEYVYSNSSDNGATSPTYVWIAATGVMSHVFANESSLRSSVYVKVAAKTGISLDATSVDLSETGMTNLAYLDVSESGLTTNAAQYYKAPHDNSYRIILPNGWTGDQMAIFAANEHCGSIAAVYTYNGTRLDIMEINDGSYSTTALSDSRIVRTGTTALQVVGGSYNGQVYRSFGDNLLAAINDAQNVSTIKTVKISTGGAVPTNDITFTNTTINTLDLSNITTSKAINITGCSSLTSLDLANASVGSVNASGVTSLASVNLTDAIIDGVANFSGTSLATAFTTTSNTIIGNSNSSGIALNLSSTGLSSFSTAATIGGDIDLSDCDNLESVNILQTQFKNQWATLNSTIIHIHATADEDDNDIITKLKVSESIQVPTGFDKANRIHPYSAASSYIKEADYVAPACIFSDTNMTLHEPESAADGDKLVYWYAGDNVTNGVAEVTITSGRTLSTIISDYNLGNSHVKVKITGPLKVADVEALKNINTTVLDLSDATSGVEGKTISELLADEFDGASLHVNTKFLIAPDESTRENLLNATNLAGLTNIWSVVATKPNTKATNVNNEKLPDGYDFTSYTREPGTLQAATVMALSSATGDYERTPNIAGTKTNKRVYLSNIATFRDLKISGKVNAYDLCRSTTVNQFGHLTWNDTYTEAAVEAKTSRALVGQEVFGPFSSCFNVSSIDLEKATFVKETVEGVTTDYVTDMTLSALNILSYNATKKVVIPTDPSVEDIPADFMNSSIEIDAICIPYNIKRIRSRAFNTIDYVWTTSGTGDPEGSNTKLDNGAEYTSDGVTTRIYATNWDGDKKVKSDFDYTVEPTGGSYTFSSNIELIESGAFANTRPHVKDVYVLNTVAPECHVDAFNTVMYLGNGGYSPVIQNGIITRDSYQNGGFWITMLHYPRQTATPNVQRYTDPTRSYSIATGERDGKGAMLYFPNQSEFIRAYVQGTYGYTWNAWNPVRQFGSMQNGEFANVSLAAYNSGDQGKANTEYNDYKTTIDAKSPTSLSTIEANHPYYTFYDVTASGAVSKPTDLKNYYDIYWDESSYSTSGTDAQHLYPANEDYRGWHQFVLNAYAANTVLKEEPYRSYINDNDWWTICPTFDMTKSDIIKIFGDENNSENIPFVSRLLYVRREYSADNDNYIYLNFSKNLMVNKENRNVSKSQTKEVEGETVTTVASQHGNTDANGVVSITSNTVENDDVVMSAGVPYLIKPYIPSGNIRMFQVFPDAGEKDKMLAQYSPEQQTALPFKPIVDKDLYDRMVAAKNLSGTVQMELIHKGLYTVPVFFKGPDNITMERAASATPSGDLSGYQKSADWYYTFVGSFYQSFIPPYSYYLGKKNGVVSFFWNDKFSSESMRWINETGVICPTKRPSETDINTDFTPFSYTIASAAGGEPAQWKLFGKSGNNMTATLPDDSFTSSSSTRQYKMVFDSYEMPENDITGVNKVSEVKINNPLKVYSIGGQLKGNTLNGLAKGIYIVNGKKYIVK